MNRYSRVTIRKELIEVLRLFEFNKFANVSQVLENTCIEYINEHLPEYKDKIKRRFK